MYNIKKLTMFIVLGLGITLILAGCSSFKITPKITGVSDGYEELIGESLNGIVLGVSNLEIDVNLNFDTAVSGGKFNMSIEKKVSDGEYEDITSEVGTVKDWTNCKTEYDPDFGSYSECTTRPIKITFTHSVQESDIAIYKIKVWDSKAYNYNSTFTFFRNQSSKNYYTN